MYPGFQFFQRRKRIVKALVVATLVLFQSYQGWSQSETGGLFFSEDLYVLAKQNKLNLIPENKDEVRAEVVAFDDQNDVFKIKNERDTALSVAFWLCPQNMDAHPGTLLGEENNFYFRYLSNRRLQFNHYLKQDINTPGIVTEGQWQHIGFSLQKDGRLTIYFNGLVVLQDSIRANWWQQQEDFIIGNDHYDVPAEGRFDDLKIWDRAITSTEMQAVYKKSLLLPSLEYGLKCYLPLENNAKDISQQPKKIEAIKHITFGVDSCGRASASFGSKESYIRLSGFSFDNQKTIALWIKPSAEAWRLVLAGNNDFTLSYTTQYGELWYSVPLMFKLKSEKTGHKIGEWIHIAVALNYNNTVDFYVNGEKTETLAIGGSTGNEPCIEIGRSLYNNFYLGNMSHFAIWDRKLSESEIKEVYNGKLNTLLAKPKPKDKEGAYLFALVFLGLGFGTYVFFVHKKTKKQGQKEIKTYGLPQKNAINFLSSFRAFDSEGLDVTNEFTPTLIRLFALVLLYPRAYKANVSSAQMSDIMWGGDDLAHQKNNRSTNVHRLRTIFKKFNGLCLVYQNKEWYIENPNNVFIDIEKEESILKDVSFEIPFHDLKFHKSIYTDGFDSLVRSVNDKRLNFIADECDLLAAAKNWNRVAHLSKLWLTIDTLSDEALQLQVRALMQLNKKQHALRAYSEFCKNYSALLNEEYPLPIDTLL